MKNDAEYRSMAFHNRAREILSSVYNDFKRSVAAIDRQGDENVFQQLRNKFAGKLKQKLQSVALELLGETAVGTDKLNQVLSRLIEQYVHEFMQKIRAL